MYSDLINTDNNILDIVQNNGFYASNSIERCD